MDEECIYTCSQSPLHVFVIRTEALQSLLLFSINHLFVITNIQSNTLLLVAYRYS